jgi:hypothetical protein
MSSSSWRKSPCRGSSSPGFWGGSPACAPPVPRVEVGSLQQTSPEAVAGRPRCATRSDFEGCVAEKSRLRRLRGLAKRGQEFIRVGKSLPLPFRRSMMGFKTRNRGPRRRLSGKDRFTDADRLLPVWHNDQLQVLRWGNRSALGWVRWTCSVSISAGMTGLSCAGEASTGAGPRSSGMRTGRGHGKKGRPARLAHGDACGSCEAPHLEDERVKLPKAGDSPYRPSVKKWTRLHRELRLPSLVLM